MTLKIIDLNNTTDFGLGLEREQKFSEFVATKTFFQRFLWRTAEFLIGKIGYMPAVFFEKEDVDAAVVLELLKHPKLLEGVSMWIENNDHAQIELLREAKKTFERIQKPKKRERFLYRGFNISSGQQTHGLDRKTIHDMSVGAAFEDTPSRAVSFSAFREISEAYGGILVTVDYDKTSERMFHITNEVMIAACMNEDGDTDVGKTLDKTGGRLFSYFESIFLPDGKPLEFKLHDKS